MLHNADISSLQIGSYMEYRNFSFIDIWTSSIKTITLEGGNSITH